MKYDIYLITKDQNPLMVGQLILVKKGLKQDRYPSAKKIGSCREIIIYSPSHLINISDSVKA